MKAKRTRSSNLVVGDFVEVRVADDWQKGRVSRSHAKGREVDVRLESGKVFTNLFASSVRKVNEASE